MDMQTFLFDEVVGMDREVLGNKGYGLVEMNRMGLPVPPGFVIITDAYRRREPDLFEQARSKLSDLERVSGKMFGSQSDPLLLSVRSGAPVSMPGMMDTILNVGLTESTAKKLGVFYQDLYLRLLLASAKSFYGKIIEVDRSLSVPEKLSRVKSFLPQAFPDEPFEQLELAIDVVFRSWMSERAVSYRALHGIDEGLGTAVIVQQMVFGNMDENSGSGVGFTRDPLTGEDRLTVEYLPNSQGEDVVSGSETPLGIESVPESVRGELERVARILEGHFGDMQDFEFTVERGRLYLLQTRNGKRSKSAAERISRELKAI